MNPTLGQLHLNGRYVGDVEIRGWHGPWGIGEFRRRREFDPFAPIYAEWARLMHADADTLSPETAERLRQLEFQTFAVHAAIWIPSMRQWRAIAILNIDGTMIEWKEGWGGEALPPPPPATADTERERAS
jgi:hypothetical protein